jgi:hypothetical protein
MLPLGFWQYWGMFAPDPVRDTWTLEAEVFDSRGLRHVVEYPKSGGYSWWAGLPRFRNSKYVVNLAVPDFDLQRDISSRHAVRTLGLPASAFPVDVHLEYQVLSSPPPGGPPPDPMTPKRPLLLGTYHYADLSEVHR